METFIEQAEDILSLVSGVGEILFSALGIIILCVTVVHAFWKWLCRKEAEDELNEGFEISLSFMTAGEIIRTVTAETMENLLFIACLVALRAFINMVPYWEKKARLKLQEGGKIKNL